jgi:hypothetical protein
MSGRIESSADSSSLQISYDEIPQRQEQVGAQGQAEDAGRPSRLSGSLAQTYAAYEDYANAGPSGEAQSRVERPKEEGFPQARRQICRHYRSIKLLS